MNAFYNDFVEACLNTCLKEDFGDKSKVKKNNAAMKKILKLREETSKITDDIIDALLEHEEERVRINAAIMCTEIERCSDKAELVLKDIYINGKDGIVKLSAIITLIELNQKRKAKEGQ